MTKHEPIKLQMDTRKTKPATNSPVALSFTCVIMEDMKAGNVAVFDMSSGQVWLIDVSESTDND